MNRNEPLSLAEIDTLVRLAATIVQECQERSSDCGSVVAALGSFSDPDVVRELALRAWRMNEAGVLWDLVETAARGRLFAACLTDRDRDCKLNVECVGRTVDQCVEHLRDKYKNPALAAEVLPGEERDGWYYVEIPASHLYFQVFEVVEVRGRSTSVLPRREDFADRYEWRHAMMGAWLDDFRSLVRRYMPEYPAHDSAKLLELVSIGQKVPPLTDEQDFMLEMLDMLGDRTSVFSPYIWSHEKIGAQGSDREPPSPS